MRYLRRVVTLAYDPEKCTGCRRCLEVCPRAVFEMQEKKARIIDRDRCIECGACANNCQYEALAVDAGVGCATAIIYGMLQGTEPDCSSCCE